jgi:D-galactarolactone cycloisomerase
MKITKVESFIVSHRLNQSFYFSQWHYGERRICLVKITTDSGEYGWGEGYGPADLVKSAIDFYRPLIIDKDPLQQETLWQKMYLRSLDHSRKGIMLSALSAIDIALWDLKGKVLDQPVSILLGGRKRTRVRAYATGMYFSDVENLPATLADEAKLYRDAGFDAIKMKVGLGVKEDVMNVEAVREVLGPDVELMVDANHAFSLREAVQLARKLEPLDISWFEEPMSPDDYTGQGELRQRTSIPIAGGECEYLCCGFLQLFKNRCVDIAQPDVCGAGGITEAKKIMSLAQVFGVELVPHSWGTGIAFSAAMHLMSNWDNVPGRLKEPEPLIEYDRTENLLRDELVKPRFVASEGRIDVPAGPGLGVDVDEAMLAKYLI